MLSAACRSSSPQLTGGGNGNQEGGGQEEFSSEDRHARGHSGEVRVRKGARITASSAQKKYDAKWDKFEKKTLKKVDKDIKKTIKEMKQLTI